MKKIRHLGLPSTIRRPIPTAVSSIRAENIKSAAATILRRLANIRCSPPIWHSIPTACPDANGTIMTPCMVLLSSRTLRTTKASPTSTTSAYTVTVSRRSPTTPMRLNTKNSATPSSMMFLQKPVAALAPAIFSPATNRFSKATPSSAGL